VVSSTYFGYGFSGLRPPASVPVSFTGLGAASIGLYPVKDSMGGSVGSPLVSLDVHPSVGSGTVAVAGPLGSAGVPLGAHGIVPGHVLYLGQWLRRHRLWINLWPMLVVIRPGRI